MLNVTSFKWQSLAFIDLIRIQPSGLYRTRKFFRDESRFGDNNLPTPANASLRCGYLKYFNVRVLVKLRITGGAHTIPKTEVVLVL